MHADTVRFDRTMRDLAHVSPLERDDNLLYEIVVVYYSNLGCSTSETGHELTSRDTYVTSALLPIATELRTSNEVGSVPILLKKSEYQLDPNFLAPSMRFSDVDAAKTDISGRTLSCISDQLKSLSRQRLNRQ
jgi:hypothetical protein